MKEMMKFVRAVNTAVLSTSGLLLQEVLARIATGETLVAAAQAAAAQHADWEVREDDDRVVLNDGQYGAGVELARDLSFVSFWTCGGHGVRLVQKDETVVVLADDAPSFGFWGDGLCGEAAASWRARLVNWIAAGGDPIELRRRELPAVLLKAAGTTGRYEAAAFLGRLAAEWVWETTPAEFRDEGVAERAVRKGREATEAAAGFLGCKLLPETWEGWYLAEAAIRRKKAHA